MHNQIIKRMEADRTEHLCYDFCNWDHFVCVTAYYALVRSPTISIIARGGILLHTSAFRGGFTLCTSNGTPSSKVDDMRE